MTRLVAVTACALLLGFAPDLACAQSLNPALDRLERETQVMAAVTLPLGRSADKRETAPRFELLVRNRTPEATPDRQSSLIGQLRWRESRIGFTLDEKPNLLVNGSLPPEGDRRDGVSTLGWVAIGAGAVVAIVVLSASSVNFDNVGVPPQ
jgi:hypothetical protein